MPVMQSVIRQGQVSRLDMKTKSKFFTVIMMSLLPLFVLFVWVSSIHKVVEHGEYLGFIIGMNKSEVIAVLRDKSEMNIRKINLVKADKSSKAVSLSSLNNDSDSAVKWVVMYDSAYFFNSTTLDFCDESLCKIYRKRHYLEYP
jgi:hypothetical protein